MKFKVGDKWFKATKSKPIMVVLTQDDKFNIANMDRDATRYAIFTDGCGMSKDEQLEWMRTK